MATLTPTIKTYPPFQIQNEEGLWIEDVDPEATEEEDCYLYTLDQTKAFIFNGSLTPHWQAKREFILVPVRRN